MAALQRGESRASYGSRQSWDSVESEFAPTRTESRQAAAEDLIRGIASSGTMLTKTSTASDGGTPRSLYSQPHSVGSESKKSAISQALTSVDVFIKKFGSGADADDDASSRRWPTQARASTESDDAIEIDIEDDTDDPLVKALTYAQKHRESQKRAGEEARFGLLVDEDDVTMLTQEHAEQKQIKRWIRFDAAFGSFVALNGLLEGIVNEGFIDSESNVVWIMGSVFLVLFIIEWGVRWYFNPLGFYGMICRDRWTCFDFIIIVVSVIDLWVLSVLDLGTGSSMLAVLRVVRLVRLVRLLRLLKQLRELWVLVSGMTRSLPILMWSVLLILVICYIFGLLLFDLVGQDEKMAKDPVIQEYWGSLGRTMLSLLQIATYDAGGDLMRMMVEAKYNKREFMPIFVIFVAICSLGVFNLMVGVLLTSALEVTKLDSNFDSAQAKLIQHQAITELRELLMERCSTHIGASPGMPYLSRSMLLTWLHQERTLPPEDRVVIDLLMRANITEEDVNCIFNEIKSIHGSETQVLIDDFVQGCIFVQSEVHPLHITNVMAGLRSINSRLAVLDEHLCSVIVVLDEAIGQVRPVLKKYHTPRSRGPGQRAEANTDNDPDLVDNKMPAEGIFKDMAKKRDDMLLAQSPYGKVSPAERSLLRRERIEKMEAAKWARFDSVFIFVVLLNGLTIGVDATKEVKFERNLNEQMSNLDFFWLVLEFVFYFTYIFEFLMRSCFYYQMKEMHNYKSAWWVIPEMCFTINCTTACKVCKVIPAMCRDSYIAFDVVLIVCSTIDNFVLRFFFANVKYIMLLRLFRGLRLLRLARLLYLFHELVALLGSMIMAAPVVFWSVIMLFFVVYMSAVFIDSTVMEGNRDNPIVARDWGHLSECMLTLLKIATFAGWGQQSRNLAEVGGQWVYLFITAFFTIAGLGIMNLVTGVVVQAAFRVVAKDNDQHLARMLAELKTVAVNTRDDMYRDLEAHEDRKKDLHEYSQKSKMRNFFLLWKAYHKIQDLRRSSHQQQADADDKTKDAQEDHAEEDEGSNDGSSASDSESEAAAEPSLPMGSVSTTLAGFGLKKKKSESKAEAKEKKRAAKKFQEGFATSGEWEHEMHKIAHSIKEDQRTDMAHIGREINKSFMTSRELWYLLEDAKLVKFLHKIGIRPDGMVMLFQKLDTMAEGQVSVDQYIEGLQRMQTTVQGIDVAASKSVMRRLFVDASSMSRDAVLLQEAFLEIVCQLRGVTVTGSDRAMIEENAEEEDASHDHFVEARERQLHDENNAMEIKLERLRGFIDRERAILEKRGDVHIGVALGLNALAGQDEEKVSVTSAQSDMD